MAKAPRSLAGRVVAITGGARGIGRATAHELAERGARVAIGDLDAPLAERTAGELGHGAVGLPLDVTDRLAFAAFLEEAERRLGSLEVLVNNAGMMPIGPFLSESDRTARRMVDVNLHGVILGSKLALERFVPRGRGHLVNVASIAGRLAFPGGATYCATKHAVVGLSETLRAEVRGTGVQITTVMPGVVNTELGSGLNRTRGVDVVEPEQVAAAIADALQSGRPDVYVPHRLEGLARLAAVLPRWTADLIARLMGGDRVLLDPDPAARAAYRARTADYAP